MLNATWLETFVTLCQIGHFTRTADQLNMTQPGVSQHLRKLEAQVGQPLILQEGKTFTLTPAGEAVFALGKSRRKQEQDLQEAINLDDPDAGIVNIASSGSFAMWLYPHLLTRMHEAPNLTLNVTAAPQHSIISGVLDKRFDLGIVPEAIDHPRLMKTQLAREELCLILPKAFEGQPIDLKDLERLGFVAHPDGYGYADDLLSVNFGETYQGADRLRVRTFVNQIGQIPIPVAQGLGYTILPKSGIEAFPDRDRLCIVPLRERRFQSLWLISYQGRSQFARIAALQALIERKSITLAGA